MAKQSRLDVKRKQTREEILAIRENVAPALFLNLIRYIVPNLKEHQSPMSWILNVLFINFLMVIPGLVVAFFLNEVNGMKNFWLDWVVGVEISICGLLATYLISRNIMNELSGGIIKNINNADDLLKLLEWLRQSWSAKTVLNFTLPIWIAWVCLSIGGVSYSEGRFIGFGLSIITIPTGFAVGVSSYVILWVIRLAVQLGGFRYDMNNIMPVNSEVIERLSKMFNDYLYVAAAFFAFSTLLSSFVRYGNVVGYPFVLAGWATITTQFFVARSTIGRIVSRAKWETLNKIQSQMNQIQSKGNLAKKETTDSLLRLADVYQKILLTRSATADSKGLVNFFSQMMLPFLGFLVANFEKIVALFS